MISTLQELLRLVVGVFFQLVDLLLEFSGRGDHCCLLSAISLPGPS